MRAENQRFRFTTRLLKVINVLLEASFLQPIGWRCVTAGGGDIVVDLPGGVAPGINTLMHGMRHINDLVALIF
ncbi:hypothetical protein D3C75_1221570 [compost metagenome]